MSLFSHLLGLDEALPPETAAAVERAASRVEPLIKLAGGYPARYAGPVGTALSYARDLATRLPGPVALDRDAFGKDPLVHALFPAGDAILDALAASQSMRDFMRDHPCEEEVYALMGMRRCDKLTMGMELSGEVIRREVPQHTIYFTSHTIEHAAPSEADAREDIAWRFFDRLMDNVTARIDARKREKLAQTLQKDLITARLHTATGPERDALEAELTSVITAMQATIDSLEPHHYLADFEAVLQHPEQYLRLEETRMVLDSMGVRREGDVDNPGKPVLFNDLIGLDRRQWTVTLIHCRGMLGDTLADRLDAACRSLAL